jgi:hypothetical protein
MHPVIAQAIASERARDMHAHAAAVRQVRRFGAARRARRSAGRFQAPHALAGRPARQPLRTPRAA